MYEVEDVYGVLGAQYAGYSGLTHWLTAGTPVESGTYVCRRRVQHGHAAVKLARRGEYVDLEQGWRTTRGPHRVRWLVPTGRQAVLMSWRAEMIELYR